MFDENDYEVIEEYLHSLSLKGTLEDFSIELMKEAKLVIKHHRIIFN
jgi:hypothetical protein